MLISVMDWKYNAGLGLIGTVVLIWVASAEVTQIIFREYKQPFSLTYIGVSMMVVYLPIAALKDWICSLLNSTSTVLDVPIPFTANEFYCSAQTDITKILVIVKKGGMQLMRMKIMSLTCLREVINLVHGKSQDAAYFLLQRGLLQSTCQSLRRKILALQVQLS